MTIYIPAPGDIVEVEMDLPEDVRNEGTAPFLVISSKIVNENSHMAILCPIYSIEDVNEYLTDFEKERTIKVEMDNCLAYIVATRPISYDFLARDCGFVRKLNDDAYVIAQDNVQDLLF